MSLISAGREPVDSDFLAIDESGKNVFFTTRDRLVPKDRDEAIDVYDAREGGGIPGESEAAASECQGEACQAPLSPLSNDQSPGSAVFNGPGNLMPNWDAGVEEGGCRSKDADLCCAGEGAAACEGAESVSRQSEAEAYGL